MRFVALLLFVGACKRPQTIVKDETGDVVPTDPAGEGEPCDLSEDCESSLRCASSGVCAQPGAYGTISFGNDCFQSDQCEAGLVCGSAGQCVGPDAPGTAGFGADCAASSDCQSPLSCYDDVCDGYPVPYWDGVDCPVTGAPFRVLFEVPRGPVTHGDFFRLPFPTDVRVGASGVSVDGFRGAQLPFGPAGDVHAAVASAYAASFDGFGPSQAVWFRLSTLPTFDTILVGPPGEGSVYVVDVTEGSPYYGTPHAFGWKLTTGQRYLCDPWIALYPSSGRPFLPGHTYVAMVGSTLLGGDGSAPVQDPDFAAMLGGPPSDSALQPAWEAMEPLRGWLASTSTPPASLAGAAVFTVEDYQRAGPRTRDAVRGSGAPVASEVVQCGDLPGPHASLTDPTRGCFGTNEYFHEVQGRLTVPEFQQGSAPFNGPSLGGAATWSDGQPAVLRAGEVTFSVTIPTGTEPPNGWPVALFAHDGGGNYRSFVVDGLARELSDLQVPGAPPGFAVVSIDTWLTGPRAGERLPQWEALTAAYEPTLLFDNPLNPVAARDNRLQSAADWHQVVRWLEELDWSAGASPIGTPVRFDLDQIVFVGHGIGASAGPLFAAHEPRVKAVVLGGASGSWMDAMESVDAPFALDGVIAAALADPAINRFQPALNLAQGIVDRTDAVNHARFLHFEPGVPNRDVLHVFGQGDGITGELGQLALARALYAEQVVLPGAVPIARVDEVSAPVTNNIGGATSVVLVAAGPEPRRLLLDDPGVRSRVRQFLATAVRDGRATLPVQ